MTKTRDAEIRTALEPITSVDSLDWSDEYAEYRLGVDDDQDLDELRRALPGWTIGWTGSSDTDSEGSTTSDISLAPPKTSETRTYEVQPMADQEGRECGTWAVVRSETGQVRMVCQTEAEAAKAAAELTVEGAWTVDRLRDAIHAHGWRYEDITAERMGILYDEEIASQAASAFGRLGGRSGRGAAKRRGDSAYYRAIRRRTGYTVSRRYAGGLHVVDVVGSLTAAKRLARQLWDEAPCRWVQIDGAARSWTSSRPHAAGMRWS